MLLVGVAVLCTAASQIVQALAARRLTAPTSMFGVLREPLVLLAYLLLAVGFVFWMVALTEVEVARTYPLFAMGFVATMVFARFGLGESISPRAWGGAVLIVVGGAVCNL